MTKSLVQRVTKIETEVHIQNKELFYRLKRLESWLICGMGAVLSMLIGVLLQLN